MQPMAQAMGKSAKQTSPSGAKEPFSRTRGRDDVAPQQSKEQFSIRDTLIRLVRAEELEYKDPTKAA
jgi:hypothetical protein